MSDALPVPASSNTFERIKRVSAAGHEFWSARELGRGLEHTDFRNFIAVITKAREACANSGHTASDHFVDINEMVSIGSGAQRTIEDWALSRYAPVISSFKTLIRANRWWSHEQSKQPNFNSLEFDGIRNQLNP